MTDKKDQIGKGPARPGEGPRRPYATIDLQATDVGGKNKGHTGAAGGGGPDLKTAALPPPGARSQPETPSTLAKGLAKGLAVARAWSRKAVASNTFLSYVAAGVAGSVLTLAAAALFGLLPAGRGGERLSPELARRLAALEQTLGQRTTALPDDVKAKLAASDARVAKLEEEARAIAALSGAQAKVTADVKALDARVASPAFTERVAKLETALAALAADDKSGRVARAEGLAAKLAELEKLASEVKTEAGSLARRFETLKGDVEERLKGVVKAGELAPVLAKLAAFEHDLQTFVKSEGERITNAQRVLLTLEIANLKRVLDRGDRYTKEIEAARKAAGDTFSLAALERHSLTGVAPLAGLAKDFRRVAHAIVDAESDAADASVLSRLLAGFRSTVRLRKAGHGPDDTSVEAIVGRMESALKDGHIGEVLAQGKKLPPKAALAAEDWLAKLEARHAADRAVADIEAALKASLAVQRPAEPKR